LIWVVLRDRMPRGTEASKESGGGANKVRKGGRTREMDGGVRVNRSMRTERVQGEKKRHVKLQFYLLLFNKITKRKWVFRNIVRNYFVIKKNYLDNTFSPKS